MSDTIFGTDFIKKYFNSLTDLQIEQFEKIGKLYPDWNDKINVISRQDIENLYTNHILHSLSIAKFFNPVAKTSFLDATLSETELKFVSTYFGSVSFT